MPSHKILSSQAKFSSQKHEAEARAKDKAKARAKARTNAA